MMDKPSSLDQPDSVALDRIDPILDAFEKAWKSGAAPPQIEAFLAGGPDRLLLLQELVLTDLEFRLKAGQDIRLEEYLCRFPEFAANDAAVLRGIAREFHLRQQRPPCPTLDEYLDRFPQYREQLAQGLTAHRTSPPSSGATPPLTRPGADEAGIPDVPGFEILAELGRGGMGVVYKALQKSLHRIVALKMVRYGARAGPETIRRFRIEAESVARLQHPNIVQIHEIGEHDGCPFLALEYLEGGSLAGRIAQGPLPAAEAARLVEVLARAVGALHERGIVHRDLKPANVLLAADGTPKIADFGLVKHLDGETAHTESGALLGTPAYMAPEQAAGLVGQVGPAADVWALGAVLYELLTGRPPFVADNDLDLLISIRTEDPVPPGRLRPRLPRDLEVICLKCLEKKPADRYATATDLADDLHRFLGGEPIRARPPSALRRASAWVRRHPATATFLAATLLLIATVIGGLAMHTARLDQALTDTQEERSRAVRHERRARQSEYVAQVRLASQWFRQGDPFPLAGMLDPFRPGEDEEDVRGFEWWHLTGHRQASPRAWQTQHTYSFPWLGYSPDGRWLATVGVRLGGSSLVGERAVRVWDPSTGKLHFIVPTAGWPIAAFGSGDAHWLAVWDGKALTRWDLRTGQRLGPPLNPGFEVHALVVHPDGQVLLDDHVWDADKGIRQQGFPDSLGDLCRLALSADGKTLIAAYKGKQLSLWDLAIGKKRREVDEPDAGIHALVCSRKSSLFAYLGGHFPVNVRDLRRPEILLGGEWVASPFTERASVLALSNDGTLLATGDGDGTVHLWDVPARTARTHLRWQARPVACLDFSPDGRTLAVGTDGGMVYQIGTDLRPAREPLRPDLGPTGCIAWSADGRTLVLAGRDRTVKIVDPQTGRVRSVLTGLVNHAVDVAVAADGATVAAVEWSGAIHLWDTATGAEKAQSDGLCHCVAIAPTGSLLAFGGIGWCLYDRSGASRGQVDDAKEVFALAFSADGRTLVAAQGDRDVAVWDVSGGRPPTKRTATVRLESVGRALAFLPDGTLATGEEKGTVRFWKVEGETLAPVRKPLRRSGPVTDLRVFADGRTLLTHGHTQKVTLWDLQSLEPQSEWDFNRPLEHPAGWSFGKGRIATLDPQEVVQIWDTKTWTVRLLPGQPLWRVRGIAVTPDGRDLITLSEAPRPAFRKSYPVGKFDSYFLQSATTPLRFWDPATGRERPGLEGPDTMAPPDVLALSPDGRTLAAGSPDGSVHVWDRTTGRQARRLFVSSQAQSYAAGVEIARALGPTIRPEYPEAVRALAFSSDGRLLAMVGSRGALTVCDLTNGAEVQRLTLDPARLLWVAFSPGGDLVVPRAGRVRFLDPRTGNERASLGDEEEPPALLAAFGHRGDLLAVAHQGRFIRLWDLGQGKPAGELFGHLDEISTLAFAPDDRTLASGSHDHSVKLWSVPAAAEVASLEAHQGKIHCLAFSPDGTTLATGGDDRGGWGGEVFLWRAPRP
jgi:eukaryotic-like serine/threonine-protein kinase